MLKKVRAASDLSFTSLLSDAYVDFEENSNMKRNELDDGFAHGSGQ